PDSGRVRVLFETAVQGGALKAKTELGFELRDGEATKGLKDAVPREGDKLPAGVNAPAPPAGGMGAGIPAQPGLPARAKDKDRNGVADEPMGEKKSEEEGRDGKKSGTKESLERYRRDERVPEAEFFGVMAGRHMAVRQLYRRLDATQEWAENNY